MLFAQKFGLQKKQSNANGPNAGMNLVQKMASSISRRVDSEESIANDDDNDD
jgi:Flp pilus assembly CpaF family ATPase